jgi:hypothetical protein
MFCPWEHKKTLSSAGLHCKYTEFFVSAKGWEANFTATKKQDSDAIFLASLPCALSDKTG